MDIDKIQKNAELKMKKSVKLLEEEFRTLRTSRATTALVEDIVVDYYGSKMKLKQLAQISIPEPNQIMLQVWDNSAIPNIEKALKESDLGAQPQTEGNVVRITLPPLTEQRRKELVKKAGKMAEQARIAIRNIRHEALKELDKLKKEGFSEDEIKRAKNQIDKITQKYVKEVDELLKIKEKEILSL